MKGKGSMQTGQTAQWEAQAGLGSRSVRESDTKGSKRNIRIAAAESKDSPARFNNLGRSLGRFFTVNSPAKI